MNSSERRMSHSCPGTLSADALRYSDLVLKQASSAENTRIAYFKGWFRFRTFCAGIGLQPLDADVDVVVNFFLHASSVCSVRTGRPLSLGTLTQCRSAINRYFLDAGLPSPTMDQKVNILFRGLSRLRGHRRRRVKALREQQIASMLDACPDTPIGCRDAAIIAIGFAGALRRSELCLLQRKDIKDVPGRGVVLHIRRSKTDQGGIGQCIAVPMGRLIQPVKRLSDWLGIADCSCPYVFHCLRQGRRTACRRLHPQDIARIVKRRVSAIDLDPSQFSGHSLRAGFVTSAAVHHARLDKIMEITRHTNPATVMQYIRDADAFTDHAGSGFL